MKIAVTGASGHLGSIMVPYLIHHGYEVIPIGHRIPGNMKADALFHLAAPRNHLDRAAIAKFYAFIEDVKWWMNSNPDTYVVNTGSWWQRASEEAKDMPYTLLKQNQQVILDAQTTLILYSVYGGRLRMGRGFIPQLIDHCDGYSRLSGASRQPRDWVHVDDVCSAFLGALEGRTAGVYDVCTGVQPSPYDLVVTMTGESLPDYDEHPHCFPPSTVITTPGWTPKVDVIDYVRRMVGYGH